MADSENEISLSVDADAPDGTITTEQVRRAYSLWMVNQDTIDDLDVMELSRAAQRHRDEFDAWLEAQRG